MNNNEATSAMAKTTESEMVDSDVLNVATSAKISNDA